MLWLIMWRKRRRSKRKGERGVISRGIFNFRANSLSLSSLHGVKYPSFLLWNQSFLVSVISDWKSIIKLAFVVYHYDLDRSSAAYLMKARWEIHRLRNFRRSAIPLHDLLGYLIVMILEKSEMAMIEWNNTRIERESESEVTRLHRTDH